MKLQRRTFLKFAGAAVAAPAFSKIATAGTYPTRPITMIVPYPAGGPTDALGRVIADRMKRTLGQPIIIENVSGGDGSIGTGRVARARPDGYTIELGIRNNHVMNGAFYSLSYDVVHDFVPISPLVTTPVVLFARKEMPANNLQELIRWLKSNPDQASAGYATIGFRLLWALFQKETSTRFSLVPYRGSAPAMQDLLAGNIDLVFDAPVELPLARAGKIKALAAASGTRLAIAPDIPTFAEATLSRLSFDGWFGLFAPLGTPTELIRKLNLAAVEALSDPVVRSRIADFGMEIFPREQQTPQALDAIVKADAEKWWPIIKESGIKAE